MFSYNSKPIFYSSNLIMLFVVLVLISGKRRSCYFSKLADESVDSILRLVKIPPAGLVDALGDVDLNHLRIRITKYSEVFTLLFLMSLTGHKMNLLSMEGPFEWGLEQPMDWGLHQLQYRMLFCHMLCIHRRYFLKLCFAK